MRMKHPHPDLDRAVQRLRPLLTRDGLPLGDFIAAGAQGNVYAVGHDRVVKVMYGGSLSVEWRIAAVLLARETGNDRTHSGIVRHLGQYQYVDPIIGIDDPMYRIYFIERERLVPDDARAVQALKVLQGVLHYLTGRVDSRRFDSREIENRYYGLSFGNADIKIVALGMNYLKHSRQLPEDPAERKQMERDALSLHGAIMWLYGRGYRLSDYFAQYEVKPENVGFRGGKTAVVLDLGSLHPDAAIAGRR